MNNPIKIKFKDGNAVFTVEKTEGAQIEKTANFFLNMGIAGEELTACLKESTGSVAGFNASFERG